MSQVDHTPIVAVVLAGGRGLRFGSEMPKQFVKLAGRMVIEHTIDVFEMAEAVDEIIVVVPGGYQDMIWEAVSRNTWSKVSKVVEGGRDRADSTASAITALSAHPDHARILVHDAARPLLDSATIGRCLDALKSYDAVDVVVPASDTIVEVGGDSHITDIPDRSRLRRGQTPQGFRLKVLRDAYSCAAARGLAGVTCDCGVVRRELPHVPITTVLGSSANLKITDGVDLYIAEKLIQTRSVNQAQGHADLQAIGGRVIVVLGASSGIGRAVTLLAQQKGARVHGASRSGNGVDVSCGGSLGRFIAEVAQREERIDAVINCAGVLVKKPLGSLSMAEIRTIVDTNLIGAIAVAQAAHPYLRASKGTLVNFTSSSYTRGRAFYATYSATKAAVVNFSQALAEEWGTDNIRVLCINPERTATPMRELNFGAEPPESLLSPDQVAYATLQAICSSLTGVVFDVRRND